VISRTDRAQIYCPKRRGFLFIDHHEAAVGREDRAYQWFAPATAAQRWAREHCDRFLNESVPAGSPALQEQFAGVIVIQAPICACCGDVAFRSLSCVSPNPDPVLRFYRCAKHRDRNPCAIEGCKRTTAANGRYASDQWLCSEHWRRFVPPHSPTRRAYHRFFRLAKRHGWDDRLRRRFWRFWRGLVAQARRKAEGGSIDETAINRMFGWEDAA
jgi:hypothetical protein